MTPKEFHCELLGVGAAERAFQLEKPIELPVQLAGPVPNPADVYLHICFFETFMTSYSAWGPWSSTWLPLSAMAQPEAHLQTALEVADGRSIAEVEPRLHVCSTWQYPLLYNGSKPQRGRGLLKLASLTMKGVEAPRQVRVEIHILHFVQNSTSRLDEDTELRMRVRLKQNRPSVQNK